MRSDATIGPTYPCVMVLLLGGCGGTEAPLGPPSENVSILVRDDFLASQNWNCDVSAVGVEASLFVTGVLGKCNVRVKADGTALSICDRIPGKKVRDLELVYSAGSLELLRTEASLDLSYETRSMVDVDFTTAERVVHDTDGDGLHNLEELCAGRDPNDPGM